MTQGLLVKTVRSCTFLYVMFVLTLASTPVFGCKCVPPPPDAKTAGEIGQWYASKSDTMFEGTVKRVDLKSVLMETKVGDLFSADLDQNVPSLQVTFDTLKFSKGAEQSQVLLTTGLGGGDCGFDFAIGKKYLVYAYADESGHLSTGICSGTRLLRESQVSVLPTKYCGHVATIGLALEDSQVYLLRSGSNSLIPTNEAEVEQDGSFCFVGSTPGNYRLVFVSRAEDSPTSFVFFPGVTDPSEAVTVELGSGQARSDLAFSVPPQPTFSVSGNVQVQHKSMLPAESKVLLLSADPSSFLLGYSKDVDSSGSFEFPHVLPGKYWAFVGVNSDAAPSWLTRKAEVEVSVAVSGLSLGLVQK
jgi:hypothetical protein